MRKATAVALACLLGVASVCGAQTVLRVPLNDTREALSEDGGERLQYLIGCALPEGVIVETTVDGRHYEFPGSIGLAPAWRERALTPAESRWVSACMLARTNAFGVTVQISLRAEPAPVATLETSAEEREQFTFQDAGFFGNLFSDDAPAYVCTAGEGAMRARQLETLRRVCSLPSTKADEPGLSRCHFLIAGPCSERPFVQDGVDYSGEVIHVYLRQP